jgi:hypothetical protein
MKLTKKKYDNKNNLNLLYEHKEVEGINGYQNYNFGMPNMSNYSYLNDNTEKIINNGRILKKIKPINDYIDNSNDLSYNNVNYNPLLLSDSSNFDNSSFDSKFSVDYSNSNSDSNSNSNSNSNNNSNSNSKKHNKKIKSDSSIFSLSSDFSDDTFKKYKKQLKKNSKHLKHKNDDNYILDHIKNCEECKNQLISLLKENENKNNNNVVNTVIKDNDVKINNITDNVNSYLINFREIIILIIIGIFIIVILNVFGNK